MPDPIILVEDETGVRSLIRTILSDSGFLVVEAKDGTAAFHQFRKRRGRIAALLTDVDMGRMDGIDLARTIREEFPSVPVLFISGLPIPHEDMERAAPGSAFIAKPFDAKSLVDAVQKLISAR